MKAFPVGLPLNGFKCIGAIAGLKPSGRPDFAIFHSTTPTSAAGCFTKNLFAAAPVTIDKNIITEYPNSVQTIIVNAGQANACTGEEGFRNAQTIIKYIESKLPGKALMMSTGVIGRQLAIEKIINAIDNNYNKLDSTLTGWEKASQAIMTTDTVPKLASTEFSIGSNKIKIVGTSKGAGMIHPNMATMLGVLCTDASISPDCLQTALSYAVNRTYNCIDVDGDTSTNDTILSLANGAASNDKIVDVNSSEFIEFRNGLTAVARNLSKQLVRDGEGATKFITIRVYGAPEEANAFRVAQAIARSSLVKCAMFGKDPNWGRILCAVGNSGVNIDPYRVNLYFSNGDEEAFVQKDRPTLQIVSNGQPRSGNVLSECAKILQEHDIIVEVDLGIGSQEATVWTCDLSTDYVKINSDYTT